MKLPACLLALALTSCAHRPVHRWDPSPTTFGFYAVQCEPVREVYCVADEYMSAHECELFVPRSVLALNDAAGQELLHYAGTITRGASDAIYRSGALVIIARPQAEFPDANTLGATAPDIQDRAGTACIDHVAIALSAPTIRPAPNAPHWNPWQVLMHELAHAVGAMHTDQSSHFKSIMDPAASTGTDHFTQADKVSLRAAYKSARNK